MKGLVCVVCCQGLGCIYSLSGVSNRLHMPGMIVPDLAAAWHMPRFCTKALTRLGQLSTWLKLLPRFVPSIACAINSNTALLGYQLSCQL